MKIRNMFKISGFLVLTTILTGWHTQVTWADARHFTYSHEADGVLEKGQWEFEQWLTFKGVRDSGKFYRFDLREEIEYGVTSRLTTAAYLNFRDTHADGVVGTGDRDGMEFKGVSGELKYMVVSPNLHPLGLLLYFEPTYEGEELEIEEKIVLQHNFGDNWIWVFNIEAEHEWEFEVGETIKELGLVFSTGLAYKITPHWSLGLEARAHNEFENYSDYEHTAIFAGPNVHYENGRGWVTFTVLPQITGNGGHRVLDAHEALEARVIAGVLF